MKKVKLGQLWRRGWVVLAWMAALEAGAGEDAGPGVLGDDFSADSPFQRGRYEAVLNNGVMFSPFLATRNRPPIDYTLSEVQLGYMLGRAKGPGWLRGNFEVAGEGFGGGLFEGTGSFVAGFTGWLRYNFVPQPNSRLVPYAQAGGGLTATDLDRRILGQDFNFNLGLGAGLRYLISRHWSLNLEYRYQHISNANLSRRNIGINANGPLLGISYLF